MEYPSNKFFQNLKQCHICLRNFTPERIIYHETICKDSSETQRSLFDSTLQRIGGTEVENITKKEILKSRLNDTAKTKGPTQLSTNWRAKDNEFMKRVRNDKKPTESKSNNVPLTPNLECDDFLQCPLCLRTFNTPSFERHIKVCAEVQNKKKSKTSISYTKSDNISQEEISTKFSIKTMLIPTEALTLKQFLVRQRVLQLYKEFFRATKQISEESNRKEVQDWIRSDFKNKKNEKDEYAIKLHIQNGQLALRELKSNIAMAK